MVPLVERPAQEELETHWGGQEGKLAGVPVGWFALIGVILAGVIVWGIYETSKGEAKVEEMTRQARTTVEEEAASTAEATRLVDRVEVVLAEYLKAETVEEILPWVRDPERVRPLIEDWLARNPKKSAKFKRLGTFQPSLLERFWLVRAEMEDAPSQHVHLEQTGDAEVKVDWESHVCYQPMAWDDYVSGRPDDRALDFRVWVSPDTHFSHEFADSSRWACFRLGAKDSDEWLYGYAAADSDIARHLKFTARVSPGGRAPFILKLRVPAAATSPRGVVIESVVCQGWTIRMQTSSDGP